MNRHQRRRTLRPRTTQSRSDPLVVNTMVSMIRPDPSDLSGKTEIPGATLVYVSVFLMGKSPMGEDLTLENTNNGPVRLDEARADLQGVFVDLLPDSDCYAFASEQPFTKEQINQLSQITVSVRDMEPETAAALGLVGIFYRMSE
jgi:hypothetical protein